MKASSSKVLPSVLCQAAAVGDVEGDAFCKRQGGQCGNANLLCAGRQLSAEHSMSKEGDAVHKGDVLVTFDTEDLEPTKKKADLDAEASEGSYQSALQQSNEKPE